MLEAEDVVLVVVPDEFEPALDDVPLDGVLLLEDLVVAGWVVDVAVVVVVGRVVVVLDRRAAVDEVETNSVVPELELVSKLALVDDELSCAVVS